MCGTFQNFTHESNLWISNGGTRSVIHYDADHNLHCMIAGRKDFMMIENKYSEDLYFGPKVCSHGNYNNIFYIFLMWNIEIIIFRTLLCSLYWQPEGTTLDYNLINMGTKIIWIVTLSDM